MREWTDARAQREAQQSAADAARRAELEAEAKTHPRFSPEWRDLLSKASPSGSWYQTDEGRAATDERWEQRCESLKEKILAGDRASLFELACDAVENHHVLPGWAAWEFGLIRLKWEDCLYGSLDEAFDVARPKGFNAAAESRKRIIGGQVAHNVHRLRTFHGYTYEGALEAVAEEYEVSATLARRWYAEFRKADPDMFPPIPRKKKP